MSTGGWNRFIEVTDHVLLFRSSAPNYNGSDNTQRLTQESVDFLVQNNINRIISFNAFSYNQNEINRLKAAHIDDKHLQILDFTPQQLAS
ncbi:hypothetical protein BDN72DRAFT_848449 [Pluteus cervinus]|uniref:Uncharacterized protein n=1 Tax=Pluteus cervinus TaxID=181527 RepID=A0ACD3AA76_9AGAR|nr:hypothetical protein BDN72DRAFT_848449 [Pluteus cervinus]